MCLNLFCSELNNMGIWYRMGNVPRAQDSTHTPTTNNIQNVISSSGSVPLPAAPMPKYVHPNDVVVHVFDYMCDLSSFVQLGHMYGHMYSAFTHMARITRFFTQSWMR